MNKPLHLLRMVHGLMLMAITMVLLSAIPATVLADPVAYARFADNTLTFYYDENKGQTDNDYSLNTGAETPEWNAIAGEITKVVFDESFKNYAPTSCRKWFHNAEELSSIEGIENLNTAEVTNMGGMFYNCQQLTTIDLSHFNTSKVTDMHSMFYDCCALTSLDLSGFDVSHVVDMSQMFYYCNELAELKTGGFKSSAVEKLNNMFDECNALVELDLSGLNTAKVTDMTCLFADCESLTKLDISAFNTEKVTNMAAMFLGCSALTSINLKNFDTSLVTDMSNMFYGCSALTSLNLSNFNTESVTDMAWMFAECSSLKSLDLYSFETSLVTDMRAMFYECSSLTSLDIRNFNTANVENMYSMFRLCSLLTKLDLSHFNTSKVTDMSWMFDECNALTTLDLSYFDTGNVTSMEGIFYNCYLLSSLDLSSFNTAKVTNMSQMFKNNSSLATIYVSKNFTTDAVTTFYVMFSGCTSLKGAVAYDPDNVEGANANYQTGYFTLWVGPYVRYADETLTFYYGSDKQTGDFCIAQNGDTPDWVELASVFPTKAVFDESFSQARPTTTATWFYGFSDLTEILGMQYLNTSEVTDMLGMFCGCTGLSSIDLSHFNTDKVVDMSSMFAGCNNLTTIDLSRFNTSQVTCFSNMFYECTALKSIDVSGFNTSQAVNMAGMFEECTALTSLNLSNFNTSNVATMESMFGGCKGLTTLDLSSFKTSTVMKTSSMFDGCTSLHTIYVSANFTSENVAQSYSMFNDCTALKGAVAYDAGKTNIDYANYTDGYFTKKVGTNGTDILGATGSPLTIESLAIDDAKTYALNQGEDCQAATATYSRQMSSTWGTLCLPFAINAAATGNTCNFYALKSVNPETVTLTPIESGTIEAGTPVVISKKTAAQASISVTATDAAVVAAPVNTTADASLAGTFVGEVLTAQGYFIAKDKFYRVSDYSTQGVKVSPFRAYITASGTGSRAAALSIVVDGSTTGIDVTDTIDTLNNGNAEYYDMSGRRTDSLQKGVNIIKIGNKTRKVIVK